MAGYTPNKALPLAKSTSNSDNDALPLYTSSAKERSSFIENEWTPFLSELGDALIATKTRYHLGCSPEEILPPRESWIAWADRIRELTTRWYGQPNVSVLYEFLIECSFYDCDSAYKMSDLRQEWSEDGWTRCIDGEFRATFYKKGVQATRTYATSQKAGESAIDSYVLPNVMTAAESHVLLAGKLIKDFTVRWCARRQRKCLAALAKLPSMPTTALGLLPAENLREVLGSLSNDELAAAGVSPDSPSLRALRATGLITSSFGQFTSDQRTQIQEFLQKMLGEKPTDGQREDLDDFVAFIRAHPGRIYKDDSNCHHAMLQGVLLSKQYVVVKRSCMAQFAAKRYFSNMWERTQPLIECDETGGEKELRPSGAQEFSRFVKNAFPYFDSHGMSLGSGGVAEGSSAYGSLAYEFGVSLATDGHAKVGNWFATDFEKILKEAVALNPAAGLNDMLPGDTFHELCQNPRVVSSIRETQHTQIGRGGASMWPVMRLEQKPVHVPILGGILDIIQIGSESDAFQVVVESQSIAAPAIVDMFCQLRLVVFRKCGTHIDFVLLVTPRGDGWFRASFAPVASIKDKTINEATGEKCSEYSLPAGVVVDSNFGKGNMVVWPDAWKEALKGESTLRRVYDYNRLPGSRTVVSEFLKERYSYVDDSTGMCMRVVKPVVPNGGKGPSLTEALFPKQADSQ